MVGSCREEGPPGATLRASYYLCKIVHFHSRSHSRNDFRFLDQHLRILMRVSSNLYVAPVELMLRPKLSFSLALRGGATLPARSSGAQRVHESPSGSNLRMW